jgi:hypothetical protein
MKNIQQLVDETLNSLDGVQRAEANPFLYTKIEQKLKNRYEPSASYQRKLMPVLAVALVLFISLNVVSYFKVSTNDSNATSVKSGNEIENFANEYNLSEETGL